MYIISNVVRGQEKNQKKHRLSKHSQMPAIGVNTTEGMIESESVLS